MELALETGISPRHLSFVENGHSKPSVDVVIRLGEFLQVPLRTRNTWLLTAGYAVHTTNFMEWGSYLLQTMQRLLLNSRDEHLMLLMAEVNAYSNVQALHGSMQKVPSTPDFPLLIPCKIRLLGKELAMFTTLTTFGSPKDITLHEICIELFYPADEATKAFFN